MTEKREAALARLETLILKEQHLIQLGSSSKVKDRCNVYTYVVSHAVKFC